MNSIEEFHNGQKDGDFLYIKRIKRIIDGETYYCPFVVGKSSKTIYQKDDFDFTYFDKNNRYYCTPARVLLYCNQEWEWDNENVYIVNTENIKNDNSYNEWCTNVYKGKKVGLYKIEEYLSRRYGLFQS